MYCYLLTHKLDCVYVITFIDKRLEPHDFLGHSSLLVTNDLENHALVSYLLLHSLQPLKGPGQFRIPAVLSKSIFISAVITTSSLPLLHLL